MTLLDRIRDLDPIQARRYERTSGRVREIAMAGIRRHFDACDRNGVEPDTSAVREIIDDAWNGRAVYAEMDQPIRKMRERQDR